jgi:RHS repeat-associated protein
MINFYLKKTVIALLVSTGLFMITFAVIKQNDQNDTSNKTILQQPARGKKSNTTASKQTGQKHLFSKKILASSNKQLSEIKYLSSQQTGIIGAYEGKQQDNPADNIFTIKLDQRPNKNSKVWLSYELTGVDDYSNLACSVNDHLAMGGYLVKRNNNTNKQRVQLNPALLKDGDNYIQFGLPENADYGYKISNLSIEIENEVQSSPLIINAGNTIYSGKAYIHGFVQDENSEKANITVDGKAVKIRGGEFEAIITLADCRQVEVKATLSDGKTLTQKLNYTQKAEADKEYTLDQTIQKATKTFEKGLANTIQLENVQLNVGSKALLATKKLSITTLRDMDLPALDMGITNVTDGNKGFRFLPHGEHFTQGATVALKYDRTKIPSGYTENDIKTYYFDNQARHWVALARDSVDKKNHAIISRTTHFTDMINGVIKTPESPETQGFAPTMLNDIKAADPAAKVEIIAPPSANNRGTAGLSYSFELPPARNGMSPSLGIQYNSDSGSGWLGEGWDLNVPSIHVDTRWGVPRYNDTKETETYSLAGTMLTTLDSDGKVSIAHRGDKISRTANRQFYPRTEGSFSKIIRKGNLPSNYSWEVTDKNGTIYTYGGDSAVLKGTITNIKGETKEVIVEWKLKRVQELHGDYIEYSYLPVDEPVRGGLMAKALYLYKVSAGNKGTDPHTVVTFQSDSLKSKQMNSARYGFLTSNNRLLNRINVAFEGEILRSYAFTYKLGAFNTTILDKVAHLDSAGNEFASHTFDYYDDVQSKAGYVPFKSESETWNMQKDEITAKFINKLTRLGIPGFNDQASALGGSETDAYGASFYLGFGLYWGDKVTKGFTAGGSVSYSWSKTSSISTLIDINGDGLPDKVFRMVKVPYVGSSLYFRPNITTTLDSVAQFGEPIKIVGAELFSLTNSNSLGYGGRLFLGLNKFGANGGIDKNTTYSDTPIYFSDVNNDGLIDIVNKNKVYFNHITYQSGIAVPSFSQNSSDTPNPIKGGGVIDRNKSPEEIANDKDEQDELAAISPMQDVVRVWEAPFTGNVKVEGTVQLITPTGDYDTDAYSKADGVRVAIQVGGLEKWSQTIPKGDANLYNANLYNLPVQKGQRVYFRVQSGNDKLSNGSFDNVVWSPSITYIDANRVNELNPDSVGTYSFKASEGNVKTINNITSIGAGVPVHITGKFVKPFTSNSITLKVILSNDEMIDDSTKNINYQRQVVYQRFYHGTQIIDEDLDIQVENSLHGQNFEFEIASGAGDSLDTNTAWERVKWKPLINYTADSTSYVIPGTVKYSSITSNQTQEGESFIPGILNTPKTKPLITFKSDIPPSTLNGKIVMCLKRSNDYLDAIKEIKVVNGIVNDSVISVNLPPTLTYWVDYYIANDTLASAISSAKAILYSLNDTVYTAQKTINANVFTKRNNDGFGPMWRHWGQFVYNAGGERYKQPIDESLLRLPKDSTEADVMNMAFMPMTLDGTTKSYWMGQNENINLKGDTITAARLGIQDVLMIDPFKNMGTTEPATVCDIESSTADAPILLSKSTSTDWIGGASIGMAEGSYNHAKGKSTTRMAFADMNGDGYPDFIESNKIQLTNTNGGRDGEVISGLQSQNSESESKAIGGGGEAIHAATLISNFISGQNAANRANTATSFAKGQKKIPVSASFQWNKDSSVETFLDVNGDGLPDKILSNKQVQLNLGYSFSAPVDWNLSSIEEGYSTSLNAGAGTGFDIGQGSFSGGYGIATTFAHTNYCMMDLNSDGLADKVRKDNNNNIYVSFNLGNKFSDEIRWKGPAEINQSTSTSESLNAAFNLNIYIPLIFKISMNPGGFASKTINRPVEDIRDVDGDGYPDIISSGSDEKMTVTRSAIARTNKLKTVYNPLGGSFTLDYEHSQATYDHPGGKWVMKSVTEDDGLHDDGVNTKTVFEYTKGRQERHEREFLGFGRVVSKSIDTENGGGVYRTTTQLFDVSNYYSQANLISTMVADANGNIYHESDNEYYSYKVTPKNDNYNFEEDQDICTDKGIAFSPLKYTKTIVYEGKKTGLTANESWYSYYLNDHHGELKTYKYSDKGGLGSDGSGAYNYQTAVGYIDNASKHIFSLPTKVTVNDADGKLYRQVEAVYDVNYVNHLTKITQTLDASGNTAITDMVYDKAGNITKKTMPANYKGERMWYKYLYDRDYNMYVEEVDDAFGYRSRMEDYDYRFGIPLTTRDENGFTMLTTLDNMGRVSTITGPNEQAQGVPYTLKFTYHPQTTKNGNNITNPAYAITQHYDPANPTDDIETVTFVDGVGRAVQVKKDGVITSTTKGTNPTDKPVMIVSGRAKFDAFGRVKEAYYPVTEEVGTKTTFNPTFDAITPTKKVYDIMDRALQTILPDNSKTTMAYDVDTDSQTMKTTVVDAMGGKQSSFSNGSGQTVKTEQYSGPDGTITTQFYFDPINQLLQVKDAKGGITQSAYDLAGRRTQVIHPASGTSNFVYDGSGNLLSKQTANLLKESKLITYEYDYNRLKSVTYPDHPENNVKYTYGGVNASFNGTGRLLLQEDGTGAQEFQYGRLGEITQVTRTLIIPNQAIATYVTKWKYDSWNRLQEMVYPDLEKITYSYNTAGLLTGVRGDKSYSYNYVNKIGYDKFEQRNYMKYCNGAETTYDYKPLTRQLSNLQVLSGKTDHKQIMNNAYTYDAVSNVISVENSAPLPSTGAGGQMIHSYGYDGLYRLSTAGGFYTGSGTKTAIYSLDMTYDNLHNITSKKQYIEQKDVQFTGALKAGYELTYAYANNPQQISTLADESYRTEGKETKVPVKKMQEYSYDANGNLVYVNTALTNADSTQTTKAHERKLLWDEENRLQALDDNGFVSNYWYDAAGERTVKTSGDGEGVFVNSVFSGGRTGTANFTAYVNPYLVVSPGGNYTKHVYIGSQRIVSKLGDLASYGADPRRIEYAGAGLDGSKIDYKGKYTTSIQNIKDRYAVLGVPYNGTDNNDYVNGQGFCCTTPGNAPQKVAGANDNPEKLQYYYHSDHLGSSSLITDLDGNVAQHIEYVPFGEVFIEERNATWNTPYKFNGKELDEETGLYYYGARYYDPRTSAWISVDPLAEKYPSISPYVYCADNPLKFIDSDGRVLFLVNGWDGLSNRTKYSSNSSDFPAMKSYWTNNNPQFINQVANRFNEKQAYLVDGSQGGASHGSVDVRHDNGYAYAQQLVKNGVVDFSEPINIVSHSMGGAYSSGMIDAFLEANPKATINLLLLAPDGAEKFSVDKRVNSAQFTFGDDAIVTNNKATVGNVDVNLNPSNIDYSPFRSGFINGLKAHGAEIDDTNWSDKILNNPKLKSLFIVAPQNVKPTQNNGNNN